MWKYECKRNLTYVIVGAFVGAIIFGVLGWQRDFFTEVFLSTAEQMGIENAQTIINPMMFYVFGAMFIGGLVNGMLLLFQFVNRFHINPLIVMMIFMIGSEVIVGIGTLLLIPSVIVYIYGWLTIPNRKQQKELHKNAVTTVKEAERVYRLHHIYDEKNEEYATSAWNIIRRVNILYFAGVIAFLLLILYVENIGIVMVGGVIFMMLFFQLTRYKNTALQPIISLLYDQCDPEACATAIFSLAKKSHKKKNFHLTQQLAQALIYLNDPHLAVDVLVTGPQTRNINIYPYHTLMAYAYYQLGDEGMVKHHYSECEKNKDTKPNSPAAIFCTQALESIQNKIDLMDQNFSKAKSFYEKVLKSTPLQFQLVDAHYYLGLIAFVEHDLYEAEVHFTYVQEHGNKMYFKQKADSFMETITSLKEADE